MLGCKHKLEAYSLFGVFNGRLILVSCACKDPPGPTKYNNKFSLL